VTGNVQHDVQVPNTVYWQWPILAILMQNLFKFQSSAYHMGHLIWALKVKLKDSAIHTLPTPDYV